MIQAKITLKRTFLELDTRRDDDDDASSEERERKNSWRSPPPVFNWAFLRWNIVIDLAASEKNALCEDFFDKYDNALKIDWTAHIGKKHRKNTTPGALSPYGWLNPPYEKGQLDLWFEKCDKEAAKGVMGIVALMPAFNGEKRWKKYVWGKAQEVWAIDGRLHFRHSDSGKRGKGANFGSMIVVWHPRHPSDVFNTVIRCDHPCFTD